MKIPSSKSFKLNGGDTNFANRQKVLFDQLSEAEKVHHKDQSCALDAETIENGNFTRPSPPGKRRRQETRQFRGKESIFKRPDMPSPFSGDRSMPDHRRNPHKWVKYSLDDVQNADMTDKSNTQTALSFLKELKARKSKDQAINESNMLIDNLNRNNSSSSSSTVNAIKFKKPIHKNKRQESPIVIENDDKPVFRGSKIILPEYIVGQKPINKMKKEKKDFIKVDRTKQMKLDHLNEIEDDD